MSFLHPALFWTLGLPTLAVVALPVLIHLINMMRHRRVEWAAMEFLLVSQKKHRTWIILKQLLLLLLRMAAVAAIVLMMAQPRLRSQVGVMLGGTRTHHIVLLDDSYSMTDRWADTDAFAEAKKVVERIGADAAKQDRLQSYTLLRFSRVGRPQRATEPDLLKEPITTEFSAKLAGVLDKMKASQTAAAPLPALKAIAQLLGGDDGEHRIVYLISDFRARQWNEPVDLRMELTQLAASDAELHLIDCIDRARNNLSIVSLAPAEGIRASGVPWVMEVAVRNHGTAPARNVSVALGEDGHGRSAVKMPEIPPGKTAKEPFQVHFPNAGPHTVTARLEGDAVEVDNHRFAAFDLPADVPVLLVDGDVKARDANYLNIALAPGESVRTGLRPQIEQPRFMSVKPLADFQAVALTNIERLDASAVDALDKYVSAGGGVVFFLGENCDAKFFNENLYRDGQGLFPIPLARRAELAVDRLEPAPDVQVEPHFMFRVFAGKLNSFLQTVGVRKYFAVRENWTPPPDSTVRVAARLRNGAPLVVERSYGKGRVVVFLTTAAPTWNNWASNPSFVVIAQDLAAYLTSRPGAADSSLVGAPIELKLDAAKYQAPVRFTLPDDAPEPTATLNAEPAADGKLTATLFATDQSGFYEAMLTRSNNATEMRRYAVNVDPAEGDLAALDGPQLATRLEGVKYRFEQAATYQTAGDDQSGSNLGEAILFGLILLLIGEQVLAWSAGYHPAPVSKGNQSPRSHAPRGNAPAGRSASAEGWENNRTPSTQSVETSVFPRGAWEQEETRGAWERGGTAGKGGAA